tara:strand:+ start:5 stop:1039 length:1035 start_codon:yes stop_codon:yes gene_type:complete
MLESFKKIYNFRLAKKKDLKIIMNFIKKYWYKKHILGIDKFFFCYEYLNSNNINFVIAINKKNKRLEAIQGFIPYSKKIINNHICGSISCVNPRHSKPFLGIATMNKMLKITKPKTYCGIGTDPKTMIPLAKNFFKRFTGKMDHYYMLNDKFSNFKIAKIKLKKKIKISSKKHFDLKKVKNFNDLNYNKYYKNKYKYLPFKDQQYIKKRYFNHPIYKYQLFKIKKNLNISKSFLITREVKVKNRKILRIVDFRGEINDLIYIGNALKKIIYKNNYEYLDIICSNVKPNLLKKSGFNLKKRSDKNIIPNYFEPFIKKNLDLWYECSEKNMILFKADADQDRPRLF